MRQADALLVPSVLEATPYVILDAMAAGLPVVACDVGGNPEAVADGETGRLGPARSPERFAQALLEMIGDPGKRKAFVRAGRHRAEGEFSLNRMVAGMETLYESLLRAER